MKTKILIIEDDPKLCSLLKEQIEGEGYFVTITTTGEEGIKCFKKSPFDLVLLDLKLPGISGLEVCRKIKQGDQTLPILMLTAKSEEEDVVIGLEVGADDYLTKPFGMRELLARIRAILRRFEWSEKCEASKRIQRGSLIVDLDKRLVTRDNQLIELTKKEFDLLVLLASNPGRAFTRQYLLDRIWETQFEGYERSVDSHITRLRNKLEDDPQRPRYIQTVWGIGYRFLDISDTDEDKQH